MTRILLKTAKRKTKVSRASVRSAISGLFRAKPGKTTVKKKAIAKKKSAPSLKRKPAIAKK